MKRFKLVIALLSVILFIFGCSSKDTKTSTEANFNKFCINDSLMKMIKIDTVKYSQIENEIKLIGKVTFNEDKVVKLFPLVSGLVKEVKVVSGDYVEKGQTLAVIKSTEMAGVENDLVTVQSNLAIAQKNLSATEDMYKGGIVSEKEYISAQKEFLKAQSDLNRVQNIINIYGGAHQSSEYIVKSPISGYIVEKFITPNTQIRPDNSNNMFTVSDLKNIWVIANVYETDISKINIDEPVEITTISYPDKIFTGKIDKIYNVLDPDNKTMKIRIQLENKDIFLKPEMFANVTVTMKGKESMLMIPSKCVVFDKSKNYVMIYKGKCDIQTREISIFSTVKFKTYINSGLKQGDKVVSEYQLLIYNALNQ